MVCKLLAEYARKGQFACRNYLSNTAASARCQSATFDTLKPFQLFSLTHRDDVADHELYAEKFGCERIMHAADGAQRLGLERIIEGEEELKLDNDLILIPTPRHTRGHVVSYTGGNFYLPEITWPGRRTVRL